MLSVARKGRRTNKKRASTKGKKVAKLSKPMKTAVQRLIKGNVETKYCAEYVQTPNYSAGYSGNILADLIPGASFGNSAFSSAITGTGEIYGLVPRLRQGMGEHQRIGDNVRPIKCRVDFNLCLAGSSDAGSFDVTFHMFILTAVAVKALTNYTSIPITQLLNDGQGNTAPWDGTLGNSLYPINNVNFKVLHHKKYRLFKPAGNTNNSTSQNPNVFPPGTHAFQSHSLNIPLPKKLTYQSSSTTLPENYAPFMVCGWVRNDNTGNTAPNSTSNCMVQARTHLWYKDA